MKKKKEEVLTREPFVELMQKRYGVTKTSVYKYLDMIIETLEDSVANGYDVKLSGFGKFSYVEREGHEGRDPNTHEPNWIAACRTPKFTAGKRFKDKVNGDYDYDEYE